jgi:hypothetical protein
MNRHVNAIAGRLSLRPPQRRALEILDRITEIAPPGKDASAATLLAAVQNEFPSVSEFERCLYPAQRFDSEAERRLAVILERDSMKWFRPARCQFQIFYRDGADHLEYQPNFVAETADAIYMLETKASDKMEDSIVLAKKEAAIGWCANASTHAQRFGNKPWRYVMIPHDEIATKITLDALAARFGPIPQ